MKAKLFVVIATMFITLATTVAVTVPKAYACSDTLLGIPAWYKGVQAGDCSITQVGNGGMAVSTFATKVALNVVQAALVIVGYVAAFFIVKGGFLYIMSRGEPGNITAAKQTITNAVIGLIICLLSAAIVGAVGSAIN